MSKHTTLWPWHSRNSARMVDFSGWNMPLYYEKGALAEHHIVRRSCGLFDVSHMGRFILRCTSVKALNEYESLISSAVENLPVGRGSYGLLCRESGGIIDDVYNFRLDKSMFLLVVNAANHQKDFNWIQSHCSHVQLEDITTTIGMIAVQGPKAFDLLEQSGFVEKTTALSTRNSISMGDIFSDGIFTKTGYTGEDGVEIYAPNNRIVQIWEELLATSKNCAIECEAVGLAARDSLRFESGYALYGHEINEELTPVEARLKWACKLKADEPDFLGKAVIINPSRENPYRLQTLKLIDQGVPRQGMRVYDDETQIGWVCSGMACPTLKGFYANAYMDRANTADKVYLDIRAKRKKAEIVKRPLYRIL